MPVRLVIAVVAMFALTAWRDANPQWPASGAMPYEPGHARYSYEPVNKGTRSFRPVEPMPWGDVNRRVAPSTASPPVSPDATSKAPETQNAPMQMEQHDHH
jgi:hypothetical protein